MSFKDIIQKIKSDGHVPVALFVFAVTTVISTVTKRDLGPGYVSSLYAMYGFLAGHAWVGKKYDSSDSDTPDDKPTTTPTDTVPKNM